MSSEKLLLAFNVLNALVLLVAAILAFVGAKVGKKEHKKVLGWIYLLAFTFSVLTMLAPGPWIIALVCGVLWILWAVWTITDLAKIRS